MVPPSRAPATRARSVHRPSRSPTRHFHPCRALSRPAGRGPGAGGTQVHHRAPSLPVDHGDDEARGGLPIRAELVLMKGRTRSRQHDERGAVAIMVAFLMVVLLVSGGIVLDIGFARYEKNINKSAADQAVTAGLQASNSGTGDVYNANAVCAAYRFLISERWFSPGCPPTCVLRRARVRSASRETRARTSATTGPPPREAVGTRSGSVCGTLSPTRPPEELSPVSPTHRSPPTRVTPPNKAATSWASSSRSGPSLA